MSGLQTFFRFPRRIVMVGLILVATLPVAGQSTKPLADDPGERVRLHEMPGKLLSQGSNKEPTGAFKILSYILEELSLARPLQTEIDGRTVEVSRAWRLSITGGPFVVRTPPALVWIDDKLVGVGAYSGDLSRISVIIFDQSLLREGATISLAYDKDDPQRTDLPEKLKLTSTK